MTTWREARQGKERRQDRETRYYGPSNLGKPCPECQQKVPLELNEAGITHHPTCGHDARWHMERAS